MSEESAIRELFDNWIKSTTEGNLDLAHQCITDDAQFFVPGFGINTMDKATFAEAAAGGSPEESPLKFDLKSEIKEIRILSNHHAYLWVESTLIMTPKNGDPASKMQGHSLSILEKREGRWQIFRDANTLTSMEN